jgi:hypothetical protein
MIFKTLPESDILKCSLPGAAPELTCHHASRHTNQELATQLTWNLLLKLAREAKAADYLHRHSVREVRELGGGNKTKSIDQINTQADP